LVFPRPTHRNHGSCQGRSEEIAREWLARAGKRWRPFLAVAAFAALRADKTAPLPIELRKIAVAVECFHKASLVHDDIEDGDLTRYWQKTLHAEWGVPVALNVGDLLIGEGYRLIGASVLSAEQKAEMLAVSAEGSAGFAGAGSRTHLDQVRQPQITQEVLEIFRHKTAPAFEVSLKLGAIFAGDSANLLQTMYAQVAPTLKRYSEALGIAYQIRDDLTDFNDPSDVLTMGPSLLVSLAYELSSGSDREQLFAITSAKSPAAPDAEAVRSLCRKVEADIRATELLDRYIDEAIESLRELENPNLKGLLRRVIGRIFKDAEVGGWCKEFEQK